MTSSLHPSANELIKFVDASPTPFHAARTIITALEKAGFSELSWGDAWSLVPGGRYFVQRNGSSVIALVVGSRPAHEMGWRIAGAHTDSPALRLKTASAKLEGGCVRIGVELYGSPVVASWLDRPLGVAGRVAVRTSGREGVAMRLVQLAESPCLIPGAALHMNRDINKGFEYNPQIHLRALFGSGEASSREAAGTLLAGLISRQLGIEQKAILGSDLFLYDVQKASLCGAKGEFVCAGRLDNLAMCHAILEALLAGAQAEATLVAAFYDNEEIGSRSAQGADSSFLRDTLERMTLATHGGREDFYRAMQHSWAVSADAAHALNPNFSDKHDSDYAPLMNHGPVIKANASLRYATNAETSARFALLCEAAGVPCQYFIGRSDMPSGSTIGPTTSALLGVPAVDVGSPLWAMHSIRETQGVQDHIYMIKALEHFFYERS